MSDNELLLSFLFSWKKKKMIIVQMAQASKQACIEIKVL